MMQAWPALLSVAALVVVSVWPGDRAAAHSDADTAQAEPLSALAVTLQQRAEAAGLAQQAQWLALLHYRDMLRGARSVVDSPAFFLDPRGKRDAAAELNATIAAMVAPLDANADAAARDAHGQCAFPARYSWLREQLALDAAGVPAHACPGYEEFRDTVDAHSATFVFSSAFVSQPSSMFGHTLLRLDGPDPQSRPHLASYAVNYGADSAVTDQDGAALYALRGLAGGYPARYELIPYAAKVTQYSRHQNRDIFEYELALTPDEVALIVAHLWEMQDIHADYFYFSENCGSRILDLIEVGRPSLREHSDFDLYAIPADVARVLMDAPGLVASWSYRPSARVSLDRILDTLEPNEIDQAKALAGGAPVEPTLAALDATEAAAAADAAMALLEYRLRVGQTPREEAAPQLYALLRQRARMDAPPLDATAAPPARPDEGHGAGRLLVAGGIADRRGFMEVHLRPAYHDLLDPQHGYVSGAEVSIFETSARWIDGEGPRLETFRVAEIHSVGERTAVFKPASWRVGTGLSRFRTAEVDASLVADVQGGYGLSWVTPLGIVSAYAEGALYGDVDGEAPFDDSVLAGLGGSVALRMTPQPRWRVELEARQEFTPQDPDFHFGAFHVRQSLQLAPETLMRLDLAVRDAPLDDWRGDARLDARVGLARYF